MTNKTLASVFRITASLLELHAANPFKIKGLQSALFNIEKASINLGTSDLDSILAEGYSKSIAAKIIEISETGSHQELDELLEKTPKGVVELLNIKGIGAKKVRTLWQDLNITSKEGLLTACNSDQVAGLKGFGKKTQQKIIDALAFEAEQKGKYLYAEIESYAIHTEEHLKDILKTTNVVCTGQLRRRLPVITTLEYTISDYPVTDLQKKLENDSLFTFSPKLSGPQLWVGKLNDPEIDLVIKTCPQTSFHQHVVINSASSQHLQHSLNGKPLKPQLLKTEAHSETEVYEKLNLPYIVPELREGMIEFSTSCPKENELLKLQDLKGILHNHSTYSDGKNTLEEMARYCMEMGQEYLGISDHSRSAFYANGLDEQRILQQHEEIDALNNTLAPFKVFKGIESDILNDGSLDYSNDVLKSFDFIVASIHSNLGMDKATATQRLITAIENPYTTILGHMTGRLLLRRDGYPIDHFKIIDACAANNVVIEINSNPWRLDIDWTYIPYALEKGVMLSINPDAHETNGYHDMIYGVHMGRKGGLTPAQTLNAMSCAEIDTYFKTKKG